MSPLFDHPWELGLLLALVLAFLLELGRWIAVYFQIEQVPQRKEQMGTIRDGLFVLVSLLLGFTLAMAAQRFGDRRTLLVEEAISIGTTYLRADTLPQPYKDHSRGLLAKYVDTRLELNNAIEDSARFEAASQQSKRLRDELWVNAAALAQIDRSAITAIYINSLNETLDLHEKRLAALENRVPQPIWILIVAVSVIAVFTRGATLPSRFWLSLMLLPVTISLVVALIADLDAPSRGLIKIDQRVMQRLKADMRVEPAH